MSLSMTKLVYRWLLKAHRQISEKRCIEKDFSCDKGCQFLALKVTFIQSYLENLAIHDKFIEKRVRLFIRQTIYLKFVEKRKSLGRYNKFAKWLFNYFLTKNRSSHLRCYIKRCSFKTSQYSQNKQENTYVGISS